MEGIKLALLRFLNKVGLIVKAYHPRNSERALLAYLINQHNINLVIDVGANSGQFAHMLRKDGYRKDIISFEPLKSAFNQLKKNSADDPHWTCHNCALGNNETSSTINVANNSYSSSLFDIHENHLKAAPLSETIGKEEVNIKKISQFVTLQKSNKTLLKIDTQGYEMEVIKGAISDKLLSSVDLILVELSFKCMYSNGPLFTSIIETLEKEGFRLFQMFPEFVDTNTNQLLQANGFFVNVERTDYFK